MAPMTTIQIQRLSFWSVTKLFFLSHSIIFFIFLEMFAVVRVCVGSLSASAGLGLVVIGPFLAPILAIVVGFGH